MTYRTYFTNFRNTIFTMLGGLDMAVEFMHLHPGFVDAMKLEARYHYRKGGSYRKGAAIWFNQVVQPAIKRDRLLASNLPI